MKNHPLKEQGLAAFDDIQVTVAEENRVAIFAKKEAILSVLSFLKNYGYDHLGLISCVDWLEEGAFELVYVLSPYMREDTSHSEEERMNVLLKTKIARDAPICLSALPVFQNAEPYEREIHELFGITFDGHPRLTPLFLERDYATPPFRKDFDTRKYVKDVFDRIPFVDKEASGQ